MKGQKKTPKVAGFMRKVLAENLERLIAKRILTDQDGRPLGSLTAKQHELERLSGVPFSTIQRIMKREVGPSLDNIELLANAFEVSVYQLMLPHLDAGNPQIVKGATEAERRMYPQWMKSTRAVQVRGKAGRPQTPVAATEDSD